jgi:hypothetical protein
MSPGHSPGHSALFVVQFTKTGAKLGRTLFEIVSADTVSGSIGISGRILGIPEQKQGGHVSGHFLFRSRTDRPPSLEGVSSGPVRREDESSTIRALVAFQDCPLETGRHGRGLLVDDSDGEDVLPRDQDVHVDGSAVTTSGVLALDLVQPQASRVCQILNGPDHDVRVYRGAARTSGDERLHRQIEPIPFYNYERRFRVCHSESLRGLICTCFECVTGGTLIEDRR